MLKLAAVPSAFLGFRKTDPLLSYNILNTAHTERNSVKTYGKAIGEAVLASVLGC